MIKVVVFYIIHIYARKQLIFYDKSTAAGIHAPRRGAEFPITILIRKNSLERKILCS